MKLNDITIRDWCGELASTMCNGTLRASNASGDLGEFIMPVLLYNEPHYETTYEWDRLTGRRSLSDKYIGGHYALRFISALPTAERKTLLELDAHDIADNNVEFRIEGEGIEAVYTIVRKLEAGEETLLKCVILPYEE